MYFFECLFYLEIFYSQNLKFFQRPRLLGLLKTEEFKVKLKRGKKWKAYRRGFFVLTRVRVILWILESTFWQYLSNVWFTGAHCQTRECKRKFYELMTLWRFMVAGVWPSSDHKKWYSLDLVSRFPFAEKGLESSRTDISLIFWFMTEVGQNCIQRLRSV